MSDDLRTTPTDDARRLNILANSIMEAIERASSSIHNSQEWWDSYFAVDGVTVGETLVNDLVAAAMRYAATAQENVG